MTYRTQQFVQIQAFLSSAVSVRPPMTGKVGCQGLAVAEIASANTDSIFF